MGWRRFPRWPSALRHMMPGVRSAHMSARIHTSEAAGVDGPRHFSGASPSSAACVASYTSYVRDRAGDTCGRQLFSGGLPRVGRGASPTPASGRRRGPAGFETMHAREVRARFGRIAIIRKPGWPGAQTSFVGSVASRAPRRSALAHVACRRVRRAPHRRCCKRRRAGAVVALPRRGRSRPNSAFELATSLSVRARGPQPALLHRLGIACAGHFRPQLPALGLCHACGVGGRPAVDPMGCLRVAVVLRRSRQARPKLGGRDRPRATRLRRLGQDCILALTEVGLVATASALGALGGVWEPGHVSGLWESGRWKHGGEMAYSTPTSIW